MSARRPLTVLGAAVLLALVVAAGLFALGRPQLGALAPPVGGRVVLIRSASVDLLTRYGVTIGQAPACTTGPQLVVCLGTRGDGAPIRVEGPATALADGTTPVTVTVDGRPLVTTAAQPVVDAAGSAP